MICRGLLGRAVRPWVGRKGLRVPRWVWRLGVRGSGPASTPWGWRENILPNALNHQLLRFGCSRQAANLGHQLLQRRIGKAGGKGMDPWQHSIESPEAREAVAGQTGAGHGGGSKTNGLNDSALVRSQEPRPMVSSSGSRTGFPEPWWRQKQPSLRWLPPWDGESRAAMRPSRTPGGQ